MTETDINKKRSVVYSFEGRWEKPLRDGYVRVFFRKRRPVEFPNRVFLYVGVPKKAIIGFADVVSISEVNFEQANSLKDNGCITENELIRYIGENGQVHAIKICEPVLFSEDWQLENLKEAFGFNPPQSFSIMAPNFEKSLLGKLV